MEFWGVEVKAGEPLKVTPQEDTMIHVSQAALGESKKDKGKEAVPLFVKCGHQKLVIGTLSSANFPQVSFDLVFEKEFELSHNWKGGSVYFCGYQVPIPDDLRNSTGDDYPDSEFSDEEEIPLTKTENGKATPKGDNAAAKSQAAKRESSAKQVKIIEPRKPEEGDSDEDSEDDSGEDSEDDSDEDDESESADEEKIPKKDEVVKKRPNDSALKTPASKKAKSATPQKTDGKKEGHTATPHPSKHAGKTPANGANPKAQTPKSDGQFSCESCKKSFGKEMGLLAHNKAKHGGT